MLKLELSRLEPIRLANIVSLLYALVMLVFVLIGLPIFLVVVLITASSGGSVEEILPAALLFLAYPILGLIFGWISGFLTGVVYNVVTRWTGGLLFEFREVAPGGP